MSDHVVKRMKCLTLNDSMKPASTSTIVSQQQAEQQRENVSNEIAGAVKPFVAMRKLKSTGNGTTSLTNDSGNPASPSSLSSPISPQEPQGSAELRQMKRDCDPQFSRFADYFVICGLDLDTGLEADRFSGNKFSYNIIFIMYFYVYTYNYWW